MDLISKFDHEKYWYDFYQAKVMNLIQPLQANIVEIYDKVNNRRSKTDDQLRFFDYIYPSISQRLSSVENDIHEIKSLLLELKIMKKTKKSKEKLK